MIYSMKTIRINISDAALEELDATDEVRRNGRSAVVRRALEEYLQQNRPREMAARYELAYGSDPGLGDEFEEWGNQGPLSNT